MSSGRRPERGRGPLAVAAGSWGGQLLSMGDYVTGTGAPRGASRAVPEGANVGYPLLPKGRLYFSCAVV